MRKTGYANIVITIGRNVGAVPLSDSEWHNFRRALIHGATEAIHRDGVELTEIGLLAGVGVWDDIREDNCKLVALVTYDRTDLLRYDYTHDVDGDALGELRVRLERELSQLAREYAQETIAYSVAPTHLV